MHEVAERARNNPLVIIGRYNIEYSSFKEPIPVTQAMADSIIMNQFMFSKICIDHRKKNPTRKIDKFTKTDVLIRDN